MNDLTFSLYTDCVFICNHSILRLDTHCSLTYLCSVIINDKDYGAENGAYPPNKNGLIHPQLSLKWA